MCVFVCIDRDREKLVGNIINILFICLIIYFVVGANGSGKSNFFHGMETAILLPLLH